MINTLKREPMLVASLAVVMLTMAAPAFSQAPTDAQRSAIRSQCRADYQAHCASIPPGGAASLQCLQQNMSSLSPGCQSAVRAVEATAEPKPAEAKPAEAKPAEAKPAEAKPAEAKPAEARPEPSPSPAAPAAATANPAPATAAPPAAGTAAASKPAAATKPTAARKPDQAQVAAIRSACRSDYQKNCAGVPPGGAAALQCLEKNKSKLSANCEKAVSAAGDGAAPPAAGGASAVAAPSAAPAAAPALVLRPMRPREELFVLRSACGGDVRALCGGVPPGGGRIIQCLATQAASLSPACKDVLGQFATR
jgi:hypothetical protein